MTITTITIGSNTYDSYATVAEADIYLAVDPNRNSVWSSLTPDQKGSNLISATRLLDTLNWVGIKTNPSPAQNTQWPRTNVFYPDGTAVGVNDLPIEVENATILLAGSIAIDSEVAISGSSGSNKKRIKAASLELEFFRPTEGNIIKDNDAYTLIRIFLEGGLNKLNGFCKPGENVGSSFNDPDAWGKTRGFP